MGNGMLHAHFDVDAYVLRAAAKNEVPALLVQLRVLARQN